jgi:hypothetical protein
MGKFYIEFGDVTAWFYTQARGKTVRFFTVLHWAAIGTQCQLEFEFRLARALFVDG